MVQPAAVLEAKACKECEVRFQPNLLDPDARFCRNCEYLIRGDGRSIVIALAQHARQLYGSVTEPPKKDEQESAAEYRKRVRGLYLHRLERRLNSAKRQRGRKRKQMRKYRKLFCEYRANEDQKRQPTLLPKPRQPVITPSLFKEFASAQG